MSYRTARLNANAFMLMALRVTGIYIPLQLRVPYAIAPSTLKLYDGTHLLSLREIELPGKGLA